MTRPPLLAAATALLLATTASSALAQAAQAQGALAPAGSYAARASQPIPEVVDRAWPGVIRLEVDATDLDRRIYRVRETIPVEGAGPLTLWFPAWLPGEHGPSGPITQLAGLIFTANGQRIEWTRDAVETFAFHLVVPEGVSEITAEFEHLSPTVGAQGRITMTAEMLNAQWEKMLLYPAGRWHRNITTQASLKLPAGWSLGAALERESAVGDTTLFKPVTLDVLIDSPVFAGQHYRRIDLDPNGRSPVNLDIVADSASNIAPTDQQIGLLRNLVVQADRLFGARHYDHYTFLMAMTDRLGGIGLEHHRSSENSVDPAFFTSWDTRVADRDLLAHEYVHSWNGKWRRPAGQYVPNYNTPLQNELMWVYEGQTQFWGKVLAARSGMMTTQQALDVLAIDAAAFDHRVGRSWRAMQDTVNDPIISMRRPKGWLSQQRDEDYYTEGLLIWLDADTLIREKTGGRKSLDDFARAFFGTEDGSFDPAPYSFEDLVAHLNGVVPHDWAGFLRERLDGHERAPLDGLERGGYRLVYAETKNAWQRTLETELGRNNFLYSLGLQTNGSQAITAVQWDGPAFEAGLAVGMQVVAINGEAATAQSIADAITAAKGGSTPIELIIKDNARYRTVSIPYYGGLRYPRLERIPGAPDRLSQLYAARRN